MLDDPDMSKHVQSDVDIEAEVAAILGKQGLITDPGFVHYTLDGALSSGTVIMYIWMSKR
jgi:hypothetical protein